MANQQLKRLLRRAPVMEEAEFELLQSRVLSRLTKVTSVASETPTETQPDDTAEPERPALAIDAGPSANGEHPDAQPATNREHPEPKPVATDEHPDRRPETNAADSRIRSVKVVTYDLPATVVGVMAEPTLPDWDLAALPMIVQRPPRKVTKPKRARAVTESPPATKRRGSERAAVSEPAIEPIAEPTIEPTLEFGDEPTIELIAEPTAEPAIESGPDLITELRAELIAEASAEQIEEFIGDYYAKPIAQPSPGPMVTAARASTPPAPARG